MLGDDDRILGQPAGTAVEELDCARPQAAPLRGCYEDHPELALGLAQIGEDIPAHNLRAGLQSRDRQVVADTVQRPGGSFHERGMCAAPAQSLDADTPGAGEQIEEMLVRDAGSQDVEQALLGPVRDGAGSRRARGAQDASLGGTRDNSHRTIVPAWGLSSVPAWGLSSVPAWGLSSPAAALAGSDRPRAGAFPRRRGLAESGRPWAGPGKPQPGERPTSARQHVWVENAHRVEGRPDPRKKRALGAGADERQPARLQRTDAMLGGD